MASDGVSSLLFEARSPTMARAVPRSGDEALGSGPPQEPHLHLLKHSRTVVAFAGSVLLVAVRRSCAWHIQPVGLFEGGATISANLSTSLDHFFNVLPNP